MRHGTHASVLTLQQCVDGKLLFEVKRRLKKAENGDLKPFLMDWLSLNLTSLPGTDKIGASTLTAVVIENEPCVMTEQGAMTLKEAFGEEDIPSPAEIEWAAIQIRISWSPEEIAFRRLKLLESSRNEPRLLE